MAMTATTPVKHSRLVHFTPLRYPGGKGKLASFVKELLTANDLCDGEYVEPYAGGAAVALELLFHEFVTQIHINDVSRPIHAFWSSVLNDTEAFCRLVRDTPLTVQAWDKQKAILKNLQDHNDLAVGFSAFFLNRTNRSGILSGGIIGGREQNGPWKIDARYNAAELIFRIERIAALRSRISLTSLDALAFLKAGKKTWPKKTLIYLDPPYYEKGRQLYYDFYDHADHEALASFVNRGIKKQHWIVSYDNVAAVRRLYAGHRSVTYGIGYSVREACEGREIMFFCEGMAVPKLKGPIKKISSKRVTTVTMRC